MLQICLAKARVTFQQLILYFFILGSRSITRACGDRQTYNQVGYCNKTSYSTVDTNTCVCDHDKCNSAPMTSSPSGHVISVVVLLSSVVIGYLLWSWSTLCLKKVTLFGPNVML